MPINKLFQKPYPVILNKWKLAFLVSAFISFFLTVFQPFGLQFVDIENKIVILLGYGLVTFVLLMITLFILPLVFKNSFREDKWTVGKQILWLTFIVLSISIGNYLYSVLFSIFQWVGFKGFLIFILYTVPVAIIPILVITFITQNIYLKRNLNLSSRMNQEIQRKSVDQKESCLINFNSGNKQITFFLNKILYLEAEGNYVKIYYQENAELKFEMIRSTLKKITDDIPDKQLFRCHRAFAVNFQYIEKVRGNSHGIMLTLKHVENQIPVSRNNTKTFTQLLSAAK